jgi:type II secretory pathway pseudopilin PulG
MKTLNLHRKRLAGFSLVELAIVLLITTIILSAGLSLLTLKREAGQREATQKKQETIKQALINYLGKNLRLPCPGDITGAELVRSASATPPPCPSYSGIVPFKELGLDRESALDGWENFITYVVSPPVITSSPTQPASPAPLLTTAWLYTYNSITPSSTSPFTKTITLTPPNPGTPPNDAAFWSSTSTGGIKITNGTNTIADPLNATGAVVTLVSYGKNGYGALNIKGGTNDSSAAALNEVANISPASSVQSPSVIKRDTTDSPTATGGPFDDIVLPLSAYDLTGPLITNGTLQSSAQAALSQANNIVLGRIVATKTGSPATYTLPNNGTVFFPASVSAWGINYTLITSNSMSTLTTGSTPAYTLTAGDGSTKSISIDELHGILAQSAGFI